MKGTSEGPSAVSLLQDAIAALARADRERLDALAEQAGQATFREAERGVAMEHARGLELLLGLTRRHLRLLGGAAGAYGERGGEG